MLPGNNPSLKKKTKAGNKFVKIAEILGIFEEKNKDRSWLVDEIKKHKVEVSIKQDMNSFEVLRRSPLKFITYIYKILKNDELEEIEDIKTLTRTFHWFFTDIVGSANPSVLTKDQASKVLVLNALMGRTETFQQWDENQDVMTITGDGMVIGFSDSPEKPVRLAKELLNSISNYNKSKNKKHKLSLRIGVDTGPVYFIKDLTGKENFWGPGIITARRIMDLARPMQVLASSRIADFISKLSPENKSITHYCGDYKIKHGESLQIYNIFGERWGNKNCPLGKIDDKDPNPPNPQKFLFPRVEIGLYVTDQKTMMTHHSWLWDIVNVTKQETDQISYYIDGDVPKEFQDLRLTVRNENNKRLKIMSLNINKLLQKHFIVKLDRPIKPSCLRKSVKMEYDWEEPDRRYLYQVATDCKNFKFSLSVPKGLEVKPKVLKVDPATKAKSYASPAADVRYHKHRTEILWKASNLKAYEAYEFVW